jgi:hypothetical protein
MAVTNFTPLLGLALPTTGDLSGTWGTTVNDSITDLLDDAVAGTVTLSADADVTLSTTNGADNQARNAVILWTASNGVTTRNITAPAQSKAYIVINAGTGSIVIRGAGPTTGVTVASGFKALVAWNGSDFVKIASSLVNLTSDVTGTLPVANGGTGITSFGSGIATFLGTPSSANLAAALTDETGSGSAVFATSPTLVTPNLGTPSAATLTSATGLPLTTGVTGTLPIANGGTGTTSTTFANLTTNVTGILPVANGGTATATPSLVQGSGVTITGTWPNQTIAATGSGGTVTSVAFSGGTTGLTVTGSPVTTSGTITLAGTVAVANGGTGLTAGTSGGILAYTASGTLASSAALAANKVVIGGGAGVVPSTTTLLGTAAAVTSGNYIQALGYADTVTALGNTGTAQNIDITSGGVFTATLTGNCTFTLRFPVATGASSFILILTNDATPSRSVAFTGGTIKFPGGSITRTTTAGAIDVYFFFTPDGGTTYFGSIPMANLS